ncbi:peroxisome biogenesis protein NDAI_0J01710 [Naumovozyma dairenensis CBS 421]|uniref:Peroxin/Ferlin domain-containing protein n=1 Tax=Naumovozyma dairenensis (strain ATCC 10597 / BCRC 20456 / CBS 421 / NBRC 0211 / NRRL Y-12639) TaxID=1071378 RepID=G0WGY5_NAUDC|nr:hypothetical protein NDAI_0J01710 [Naumovozyma dairenensis CBS 421]CCD27063.1 hypothetical protein NDAI_0J01710 [Naumovozyma dairenensis CBS 421]
MSSFDKITPSATSEKGTGTGTTTSYPATSPVSPKTPVTTNSANGSKKQEVRAQFMDDDYTPIMNNNSHRSSNSNSNNNNNNGSMDSSTDKKKISHVGGNIKLASSPLLSSTPPSISRSLLKLYPFLIILDEWLSIITWTDENIWKSNLMVLVYIFMCIYFQVLIKYFGHLIIVSLLLSYCQIDKLIQWNLRKNTNENISNHHDGHDKDNDQHSTNMEIQNGNDNDIVFETGPNLETIIKLMNSVSLKFNICLSPLYNFKEDEIKRLFFTMIILSPIYLLINIFVLSANKSILLFGLFLITYHSPAAKVTRRLLWKFKFVRLLIFYITGLDLGGINKKDKKKGILSVVHKQVQKLSSSTHTHKDHNHNFTSDDEFDDDKQENLQYDVLAMDTKPIRFTYVLYENQRRWLGIGWKQSMLSYERTPWTDEFLNEAPSPENFNLPNDEENADEITESNNHFKMVWKWVDKTWRLDLTNDSAIEVPNTKPKTTANPGLDDGFIYYDNTWKKPSIEDSYSKYTRRRRWIRTAELIRVPKKVESNTRNNKRNSSNLPNVAIEKVKPLEQEKNKNKNDADEADAMTEQIAKRHTSESGSNEKMRVSEIGISSSTDYQENSSKAGEDDGEYKLTSSNNKSRQTNKLEKWLSDMNDERDNSDMGKKDS